MKCGSLSDQEAAPALELGRLYASRWEHELYFREVKRELRKSAVLQSHVVETGAQEIAAVVLASALLATERARAANFVRETAANRAVLECPPAPLGVGQPDPVLPYTKPMQFRPAGEGPSAWRACAIATILLMAAAAVDAQFGGFRARGLPMATPESFDGAFQFCRAAFRGSRGGDGGGWGTDYPDADLNLSTRLGELTKTPISVDKRTGQPNHLIVPVNDPLLFRCPFIMMFEVGNLYLDDAEAANLRAYLLKGGFLWVDDFWGRYAWDIWESQIRKVLPSGAYPFKDLPLDHMIFHQVYTVSKYAQIPSINYWLGSGGDTSERGDDSRPVHIRGITDERGRLMVLMTHNTDFGDSWEREGVSHEYFLAFSVDGYAFGTNALVYAMTH